jgi:hypothetical protein
MRKINGEDRAATRILSGHDFAALRHDKATDDRKAKS